MLGFSNYQNQIWNTVVLLSAKYNIELQ